MSWPAASSMSVPLTSCFTCLDSAALQMSKLTTHLFEFSWIETSQTEQEVSRSTVIITRTKSLSIQCLVWSSLVEGDEQLDRPNSQTTMEFCHSCAAWAETVFISSYQRAPWRNSFVSYGNKLLQDLFSSNHHHHFRALEDDHADNQPDHVRVPCQTTADCCLATSSKLATHFHIYQHLGPKLDFFWGRS